MSTTPTPILTPAADIADSPSSTASPSTTATSNDTSIFPAINCPHCGFQLSHTCSSSFQDATERISELEAQVRILTSKASAAADKLADYEDEIHRLRASHAATSSTSSAPASTQQAHHTQGSTLFTASSRLSSYFRRPPPTPDLSTTPLPLAGLPPQQIASPDEDLSTLLLQETEARKTAETALAQANSELEELSAALFTQANEMVAHERRERKKLEDRIETLEQREGERKKRLDRLEKAVGRVERVRSLVGFGNGT
ncbi:MAG: hypothetical protein M1834_008992 [Cirrosporium novae-zelandiae]|nr:MAG: hypothetical protein M1834_008992 [Cirrosporium novae-zelandiae]